MAVEYYLLKRSRGLDPETVFDTSQAYMAKNECGYSSW